MKKVMKYLFSGEEELLMASEQILRCSPLTMSCDELVELLVIKIREHWRSGIVKGGVNHGPRSKRLINHMDKSSVLAR